MIVFAVAVMAISKESRLFVPKAHYWTRFENTAGLVEGSPVQLVGVRVGSVEKIDFSEDPRETKIKVSFNIDRTYANRIRVGSQALMKSLNYLSQDKYIELTPGDPDRPGLPPDSFIEPGVSVWEETMQRSQSIADDFKEITASLRDLLTALNRGSGIVQEMIHNPEFGRQGVANFEGTLTSVRKLLEGVEKGQGLAGAILIDEQFKKKQVENIDGTLSHLKSVMAKLDGDQGLVAELTRPDGKGAQAMDDLRAASTALRASADNIKAGKGLIGRLMSDEAYADRLLKKIDGTAGHAESIMKKIDSGQGTLGGIINDPEVYESLKDVVAGISKSRFAKWNIRRYGKKGAKERDVTEQEEQREEEEGEGAAPKPSPTPGINP
jgi:phospholipid/cholesterol/gamma-HCH transport system substrate-binding protein